MSGSTTEIYFNNKINYETCERVMISHGMKFLRKFDPKPHKNFSIAWNIVVEYSDFFRSEEYAEFIGGDKILGNSLSRHYHLKMESTEELYDYVEDELLDRGLLPENVPYRLSLSGSFKADHCLTEALGDIFLRDLGGVFRTRPK